MDNPNYKLHNTQPQGKPPQSKAQALAKTLVLLSSLLLSATLISPVVADETEVAYVDSVHKWGAWELDIEPAAGGLSQPSTQPLSARNSKVSLRTNSISALAPQQTANPVLPITPPITTPTPVIPTIPGITPISPSVPIPTGGPGAGSSASAMPTITPISPSVPIPTGGPAIPGGGPS